MPSLKALIEKEPAKDAAQLRAARSGAESVSSSFSASVRSDQEEAIWLDGSVEEERDLLCREGKAFGRRRTESREPNPAANHAKKAESSLDFGSPRRPHGRDAWSEKDALVAVIDAKSPLTRQKDLTMKWTEHPCTSFPKYVTVHRDAVQKVVIVSEMPVEWSEMNETKYTKNYLSCHN